MARSSILEDTVRRVSASTRLTEADHQGLILLNAAGAFVVTLPPRRAGLKLRVAVRTPPTTGSPTVVTHGSENIIVGSVLTPDVNSATDADFETSGADTITFVQNKAVRGDYVDLWCDGERWYATAVCSVFDGITYTTAS